MAGIQRQRQLAYASHLFQGTQHHFFLINAAHSHVHIQNRRSARLLFLRKTGNHLKAAFPQLRLQLFLSRRINPFSDDKKRIFQTESNRFSFGGQIPDSGRPSVHLRGHFPREAFMQVCNMLRRGSAAASYNRSPGLINRLHLFRKFPGPHLIYRFSLFVQGRQPRIRLRNHRDPCYRRHLPYDSSHLLRPCGAVGSYRRGTQAFQNHGRRRRVRSVQAPPVPFKGHGNHHRQIRADFLCRQQSGSGFLQAHHGFHHQKIRSRLFNTCNLFFIYINQFFKVHTADGRQLFPCHSQITCHQGFSACRLFGRGHHRGIYLPKLSFQAVFL